MRVESSLGRPLSEWEQMNLAMELKKAGYLAGVSANYIQFYQPIEIRCIADAVQGGPKNDVLE